MNNRKLKENVMNNILDVYGYYDYIIPQVNQTIKNKFLIPRSKG